MARQDAMQVVELGEEPGATGPGDDPAADARRRARRRAVLRWWPLALAAVGGVAVVQVVQDGREDRRVAAHREVAGVVRYDVGPEPTVVPLGDEASDPRLRAGAAVGDLRIWGEEVEFGRPRAVVAVTEEGADEVWRTEVETQVDATERPTMRQPECWAGDGTAPGLGDGLAPGDAAGAPAGAPVLCLVQDRPATLTGDGGWQEEPPTRTRLLTLDGATGGSIADRDLAAQASAAVVGADLALAEVVDGTVRVAVEDVRSGERRWSTELAGTQPDAVFDPHISVAADHVLLWVGGRQWVLGRADGQVVADAAQVWFGRAGGLLVQDDDPGATLLVAADGSEVARVPALPVMLAVDDGSAPGVEIFSAVVDGDRTLRGVEAGSGRPLWEAALDGPVDGSLLLLDGVLHGADATAVWAVDARDGRERWRTTRRVGEDGEPVRETSGTWLSPLTDGRAVLLVEQSPDGTGVLAAWSLRSGEHLFRTPLPAATDGWAYEWGGALYGGMEQPVRIGG